MILKIYTTELWLKKTNKRNYKKIKVEKKKIFNEKITHYIPKNKKYINTNSNIHADISIYFFYLFINI